MTCSKRVKVLAHWVRNFHMYFFPREGRLGFRIRLPFLWKCLLRMRKRRKFNLIWIFLWWTKVSEAVCKCDWHNVRSYLFFYVQKIWTDISDSVCKDLKKKEKQERKISNKMIKMYHLHWISTLICTNTGPLTPLLQPFLPTEHNGGLGRQKSVNCLFLFPPW